jgi:phosphate transport system substrate-binding protein
VPNPAQPDELINNPYTTWNQVDPALPYDPIHVYGPARDSAEGRLTAQLLLDAGCNTFSALVALRDHDRDTFETACRQLRTDSAYEEIVPSSFPYADQLNLAPTTLGIMTVGLFSYLQDKFIANPIDGVVPDTATVAAQSYPAARAIYLYSSKLYLDAVWMGSSVFALMPPSIADYRAAGLWGYLEPEGFVRPRTPADFRALKTVQFGKWQPEN